MNKIKNNESDTQSIQSDIDPVSPRIPERYVKVTKELILEKSLPVHRISALAYIDYNQTWDEMVHYSPIYMIQWCGYKPNWRKGKRENIYDKFLNCMNWFYENGYLINFDSKNYIQNNFQTSLLNMEKILPEGNFGVIYDFEIDAIMNYQSTYKPLNKSIILLVLAYVRAFTWIRPTLKTGFTIDSKKDKPEIFSSQFESMETQIGVSSRLISKATRVLEQLGIIKTYRMPSYQDKEGVWHTDDLIYVCPYKIVYENGNFRLCDEEEYSWKKEMEYGTLFLRQLKYVSKKFYQD